LPVRKIWSKSIVLKKLFARRKADPSEALYAAIVAAARQPRFYAEWRVPDTMDGRFDILVLHMFLALERLRGETSTSELQQALTDRFFAQMDAALREAGVGDLAVGKKVRKMAEAFYGRAKAYRMGLAQQDKDLEQALARNVYAGTDSSHAKILAEWTRQAHVTLARQQTAAIAKGSVIFE
jgi:cytochrome b pre-mRNA-processing protein 3